MEIIKRYNSAHINDGDYYVNSNNFEIFEINDDEGVLSLRMSEEDYDNMININDWDEIAIKIGGNQFSDNQGQWKILSLIRIGGLHRMRGIHIVLKVKEKNLDKGDKEELIKEMI